MKRLLMLATIGVLTAMVGTVVLANAMVELLEATLYDEPAIEPVVPEGIELSNDRWR